MRYLLLIHGSDEQWSVLGPAEADALTDEHLAYDEALRRSGHLVAAEALTGPEMATVVRKRGGKVSATDGPFAEAREQLGGIYLIDATDLDEAIAIAGNIPSARLGSVEIRPTRDLLAEREPELKRRATPAAK
jgi:hypothetical protein